MPPQLLSPRVIEKILEAIERIERHNQIVEAMRFLDCMHANRPTEDCVGGYRFLPPPPPPIRRELKAGLSKDDYAALSKAWRTK